VVVYSARRAPGGRRIDFRLRALDSVSERDSWWSLLSTLPPISTSWMKTRECSMEIGHVLRMPLSFGSEDIYPESMMPDWLRCWPM
jgi:hypothetical protein